ncbi:hypothetical protein MMC12_004063 [Toensbergia leucococca]|nr:hypothetical protein [Toensbergia leucococca]
MLLGRKGGVIDELEVQHGTAERGHAKLDLQAMLREAAPRRRRTLRRMAQPRMYEDHVETEILNVNVNLEGREDKRKASGRLTSRLDHAGRKAPSSTPLQARSTANFGGRKTLPNECHTSSCREVKLPESDHGMRDPRSFEADPGPKAVRFRKLPRRRTIFVPSEDTSILTIHPGLHSSTSVSESCFVRNTTTQQLESANAALPQARKIARRSRTAAPKRVPLQPTLRVVQEADKSPFRPRRGIGKENIPPGCSNTSRIWKHKDPGVMSHPEYRANDPRSALDERIVSLHSQFSKARNTAKTPLIDQSSAAEPVQVFSESTSMFKDGASRCIAGQTTNTDFSKALLKVLDHTLLEDIHFKSPTEREGFAFPSAEPQFMAKYTLLRNDLAQIEMFEDNWLGDQEIVITQLINRLFLIAEAKDPCKKVDHRELRQGLLQIYQEPSMLTQYKRIQASLLYGALNIPSDAIPESSRLRTDVGLRQQFIDTWTKSYDLSILRAAAEVVIGREIPGCSTPTAAKRRKGGQQPRGFRQQLEAFIDACLLRNEDFFEHGSSSIRNFSSAQDQGPSAAQFPCHGWRWRRTMLRSLMIISLLDRAKELKLVQGNLFLGSSTCLSSQAVLLRIFSLLLPSATGLSRNLTRLDYHLSYEQFPLDEYRYSIENLATDLRDGVRLTRLVELLLHPPAKNTRHADIAATALPTGNFLINCAENPESRVLSQHLKFPCLGRTQKIHNVQIALSALNAVRGIDRFLDGLRAEDIVDGHREKTMIFLWSLVSKWGFSMLIDWAELEREICRLNKERRNDDDWDCDRDKDDHETSKVLQRQTILLRGWARAIGAAHGLRVLNLTTSFADGQVFAKIVDEYERYLPRPRLAMGKTTYEEGGFEAKLRRAGCSISFGK